MYSKIMAFLFVFIGVLMGFTQTANAMQEIETFDTKSYGEWTVEGTAFGDGPSGG